MIILHNGDKLMSMSEVLTNVKAYMFTCTISPVEERAIIRVLAVALEESEQFIEGALRKGRL
jgi:hypothetical protein